MLISTFAFLLIMCVIVNTLQRELFTSPPPELYGILGKSDPAVTNRGDRLSQRVSGIPIPDSFDVLDPIFITGTGETSERLVGARQKVYGNNGSVSCSTYCGGTNHSPWNNELPKDWFGAKCTSTSDAKYTCDMKARKPIHCTCAPTGAGWNA